eukprot:EG_transcript_15903
MKKVGRKRTREERKIEPLRQHRDFGFKLKVAEYADAFGVRAAARKFKVCPGSVSDWKKRRADIRFKAKGKDRKKKIFHKGKRSKYHYTEGVLQKWIESKRNKRVTVTKQMVIAKVLFPLLF